MEYTVVGYKGTHLTRRISQEHENACFGIILLLEFDKRVLEYVQFVLGVEKNASLPDFQ